MSPLFGFVEARFAVASAHAGAAFRCGNYRYDRLFALVGRLDERIDVIQDVAETLSRTPAHLIRSRPSSKVALFAREVRRFSAAVRQAFWVTFQK